MWPAQAGCEAGPVPEAAGLLAGPDRAQGRASARANRPSGRSGRGPGRGAVPAVVTTAVKRPTATPFRRRSAACVGKNGRNARAVTVGARGNATEEERRRARDRQRTAAADGRRPPHGCGDAEGEEAGKGVQEDGGLTRDAGGCSSEEEEVGATAKSARATEVSGGRRRGCWRRLAHPRPDSSYGEAQEDAARRGGPSGDDGSLRGGWKSTGSSTATAAGYGSN